jgi:hypothetical protein
LFFVSPRLVPQPALSLVTRKMILADMSVDCLCGRDSPERRPSKEITRLAPPP